MTNKKWLYPTINILLYAVGFPVLAIISLVKSIEWNSYGMYGASAFAPFIAVIILWALTAGIQAAVYFASKKKNKSGKGLIVKMLVIPIALIVGLMGIIDIAMPPLLKDNTSDTIRYEDVVFDAQGMHEQLLDRVNEFKKKNNLDDSVKYQDEEFQNIFRPIFDSMDQAYNAFDALAIEIALDQPDLLGAIQNGSLPISLAATLLLITDGEQDLTLNKLIEKNILPILAVVSQIQAEGTGSASLNKALNLLLVTKTFDGISWNIFNILGENIVVPEFDPNAEIIQDDPYWGEQSIGACLGYQDMAWLDGIPMMFFIPLMSIRPLLYAFAALIALLTVVQFFVADAYSKKYDQPFSLFMLSIKKSGKAA